jgi:GNAT superfamily N-acetyltransferase
MSQPASPIIIRPAQTTDVSTILHLIRALADYEKLSHQVTGTEALLHQHLFGDRPCVEAVLAEVEDQAVGMGIFFTNFSTFLAKPGLYLEDVFVLPEYRGLGIGKAILNHLAKIAVERDYGRMEWSVLDWNETAIGFYQRIGADVLPDWRICRVSGDRIQKLAEL